MKRFISLSIVLILLFSIVGCRRLNNSTNRKIEENQVENKITKDESPSSIDSSKDSSQQLTSTLDDLDKILDSLDDDSIDELDSLINNN